MPAIEIFPAKEAERIAQELIPEHHRHLMDARILYLFTTQNRKRAGRVVLGTAQKAPALMRYLSSNGEQAEEAGFIILLSVEMWATLTERQKIALVDHELCHCVIRDGDWSIRGHDVEEFTEIIERHGLWLSDLQEMAEAVQQLALPMESAVRYARPNTFLDGYDEE